MTAGLIELGEIMVAGAHKRLETISQNVANLTTAGYRRTTSFQQAVSAGASNTGATDFARGALRATGGSFDIALASEGFFAVRSEDGVYYTRAGQFNRDPRGRLINEQGFALQSSDGADVIVSAAAVEILEDGMVLDDGVPAARVGVFALAPEAQLDRVTGSYFQADAMIEVEAPLVRQGMIEGSNVELPAEMLAMMQALRHAEVGARVVQTYDSLLGQTISTLGRVRG